MDVQRYTASAYVIKINLAKTKTLVEEERRQWKSMLKERVLNSNQSQIPTSVDYRGRIKEVWRKLNQE